MINMVLKTKMKFIKKILILWFWETLTEGVPFNNSEDIAGK